VAREDRSFWGPLLRGKFRPLRRSGLPAGSTEGHSAWLGRIGLFGDRSSGAECDPCPSVKGKGFARSPPYPPCGPVPGIALDYAPAPEVRFIARKACDRLEFVAVY